MPDICKCKGKIKWKRNSYGLSFEITLDEYGDFKINFEPIPIKKKTKWLLELIGTKGIFVEHFSIIGKDNHGYTISTDMAYDSGHQIQMEANGDYILLQATASELRLNNPKVSKKRKLNCKLEYLTVGQLGFGLVQAETDVGIVKAGGPSELTDYDKVNGCVIIKNDSVIKRNLESWCEEADEMAASVLDVLSLAQGRLIRWSIRRLFIEEELVSTVYSGPKRTSPPIEPLFSHLHLQPILDLAVNNYTDKLRKKTGIDVAIKWLLMHPYYLEAKFLAGMTALEHLIDVYSSHLSEGGVFPKRIFRKNVRPVLVDCINQISDSLKSHPSTAGVDLKEIEEGLNEIENKLGNLNLKSLKSNLKQMLKDYKVPLQELNETEIYSLIKVRNDIVHKGLFSQKTINSKSFYSHYSLLRELLKRILLTLLKYKGQYQSFLNGSEWKKFPP